MLMKKIYVSLFWAVISIFFGILLTNCDKPVIIKHLFDSENNSNKIETQLNDTGYSDYRDVYTKDELLFKKEIDEATELINLKEYSAALKIFSTFCLKLTNSPRCLFGKAYIIDKLSEIEQSNEKLMECIGLYKKLFSIEIINKVEDLSLHLVAGKRLVNRLEFFGKNQEAIEYTKLLIQLFPNDFSLQNDLGVSYLLANDVESARRTFLRVLDKIPNDPFALVHVGFIIKQIDKNINTSIEYLKQGIDTLDKRVMDGKFFYHLGDALQRNNRNEEAYKYFEIGAKNDLFPSAHQRSLYNEPNLRAKPWWTLKETGYENFLKVLENEWKSIRNEALELINNKISNFQAEDENLSEKGDWKQFNLFIRGRKITENCKLTPKTCQLIDKIQPARTCTRGQVKFSIMHPGVHIYPHCGPTNCRLRAHLGLKIPKGPHIRVFNETKEWIEGKFIILDDSFEHEIWHYGNESRLILIVDLWHPDLNETQKMQLTPI